ncbi:ATPase component BioM of energizing module of biotin ECF transporter [hydrothermal vent metagenome]|uniref:ATPase component BioM of energizing module of biotin ECF transporter n=1 Tax=hydrothermal vent metagenome TaxID=652676 RepID=A0A3B1ALW2_9ZZZZ
MIFRDISTRIQRITKQFPAVILTGARQTGKTTLLKTTFPSHNYVSLDLPSLAEQAEKNPTEFLAAHPPPVIIDEIQYAPAIFRHIKQVVDRDRGQMGQFLLTGSQKFSLMREVSDSLAGRCVWLELETCSYQEISQSVSNFDHNDLPHLLCRGQYPELWRVRNMDKGDYYRSYVATYLERDVRQLLRVTSLRDFERFIRILASRSGQILNKSDVAKDVGVSVKAIGSWISVLEASNIIHLLEPFFQNFGKRIAKSPKVYFNDTGLLAFLLGISEENLINSPFLGMLWETFIFSELRKRNAIKQNPVNLWFYRDQFANEIDFVLESGGTLSFMEVKWSENPGQRAMQTIKKIDGDLERSPTFRAGIHFLLSRTPACYSRPEGRVINLKALDEVFTST